MGVCLLNAPGFCCGVLRGSAPYEGVAEKLALQPGEDFPLESLDRSRSNKPPIRGPRSDGGSSEEPSPRGPRVSHKPPRSDGGSSECSGGRRRPGRRPQSLSTGPRRPGGRRHGRLAGVQAGAAKRIDGARRARPVGTRSGRRSGQRRRAVQVGDREADRQGQAAGRTPAGGTGLRIDGGRQRGARRARPVGTRSGRRSVGRRRPGRRPRSGSPGPWRRRGSGQRPRSGSPGPWRRSHGGDGVIF